MKRKSKVIRKDYSKVDDSGVSLEYYGVLMKKGKARIDTKRYKKFFTIPDSKIEHRKTVYYLPTKIHRDDYFCNRFDDTLSSLKNLWNNEFSQMMKAIKTPEEVGNEARINSICFGILDYDEINAVELMSNMEREPQYYFLIQSFYAQFFQQTMSQIDSLYLRIVVENGFQEKSFSRKTFDTFIQGKQKKDVKSFRDFKFYSVYDKAYCTWNFLKHNSSKAYDKLKTNYPELINDPDNHYRNGNPAISVLRIDEKSILKTLDELPLFFDELCERGFNENVKDAKWDYDDYFIRQVKERIEDIVNPLGLPDYL